MQPPSPPTSVTHSFDCDCNKTPFTAIDVNPVLKFVQANCPLLDITSPHPMDKLPTFLHCGSKGTDTTQHSLSPHCTRAQLGDLSAAPYIYPCPLLSCLATLCHTHACILIGPMPMPTSMSES